MFTSISLSLFSAPSAESTERLSQKPLTVCEKDPHQDINPQNNNPIDNVCGRPFEALENGREGPAGGPIPPAAKEISLTDSWVHSSVLFAFQLGHIQMEDRGVLNVLTC